MIFLQRKWLNAHRAQSLLLIQTERFAQRRFLVELGETSQRIDDRSGNEVLFLNVKGGHL